MELLGGAAGIRGRLRKFLRDRRVERGIAIRIASSYAKGKRVRVSNGVESYTARGRARAGGLQQVEREDGD